MRIPRLYFLTLSAFVLVCAVAHAADTAGEVIAVKGEVAAQEAGGGTRQMSKLDKVFVGDIITTGNGAYAVIQFIDGAKATMRPDSTLAVDKYSFGTGRDGAVLKLIKGGLRAITGEIARARPESFQVQTRVATLGVRGTEFTMRICELDCAAEVGGRH